MSAPDPTAPIAAWGDAALEQVCRTEKRKRDAKAVLEEAKADAREVVTAQDEAPFVGSGGKLEPEERLTDAPARLDALEAALRSAGVIKPG